jgi:CRISPR-associated protein Cas2
MSRIWLIAYDITDDQQRRAVEKELIAKGERVQKSVFECLLNIDDLRELRAQLQELITPDTDSIAYYPLCQTCQKKVRWQGCGAAPDNAEYFIV